MRKRRPTIKVAMHKTSADGSGTAVMNSVAVPDVTLIEDGRRGSAKENEPSAGLWEIVSVTGPRAEFPTCKVTVPSRIELSLTPSVAVVTPTFPDALDSNSAIRAINPVMPVLPDVSSMNPGPKATETGVTPLPLLSVTSKSAIANPVEADDNRVSVPV